MPLFRARRTDATSPGDPDRLGPDFVRLWWSSAATNLGDGALLAAGPLLVASLTDSATVVAGASAAQLLPTLLFSLTSGALVDRLPRRTVLLAANLVRASVLALFAVALVFGAPPLWSLFIVLFAVGTSETLADGAYGALLVSLVPRPLLGRANARLALTFSVNNQLVGPPLGALLFGLGWALPYGLKALLCLAAVVLVARITAVPASTGGRDRAQRSTLRAEVREGLDHVRSNRLLRTLCACILVMNLTGVGAFAIWVLYAQERLGLDGFGFGLFLAAGAVGGVFGSRVFEWLEPRVGLAALLRWGLVVEALTYAALASTTNAVVAGAVMALFGVHTMVWGTAAVTSRQRATPNALLGRVGGVYRLADLGGAALGALVGGVVAEHVGLLVPFWSAAVGVGVLAAPAWLPLGTAGRS
ncbi:MAG TPA: MFS transporter [Nocardiopsis listeri]|uniref:MFS transporter n=1 Tax=Nocardiopsis listeri TaxID=53440 RepID=UPI001E0A6A3C|nr:MFS transporter [Nocardiopsis listeri]HJE61828.1 MFS transporter [Nocardiopsis listeri]